LREFRWKRSLDVGSTIGRFSPREQRVLLETSSPRRDLFDSAREPVQLRHTGPPDVVDQDPSAHWKNFVHRTFCRDPVEGNVERHEIRLTSSAFMSRTRTQLLFDFFATSISAAGTALSFQTAARRATARPFGQNP